MDCSTIIDILFSLRIGFGFLYFFLLLCYSLFTTMNSMYLLFFSINNITFLPIKKKGANMGKARKKEKKRREYTNFLGTAQN